MKSHLILALASTALVATAYYDNGQYDNGRRKKKHPKKDSEQDPDLAAKLKEMEEKLAN